MMIEKFLNAKHWQIFLFCFGIPFVFQIVVMFPAFDQINNQGELDPDLFFDLMMFAQIIVVLFLLTLFGWFWSIAIGLQAKIPEGVKMKVGRFKVIFFIPLIYLSLISCFIFSIMESLIGLFVSTPTLLLILIINLFSMFCLFYVLYFTAKTFKTVELQREVSFSEFVLELLILWVFPIGVWILQPKINKMMEEEDEFL